MHYEITLSVSGKHDVMLSECALILNVVLMMKQNGRLMEKKNFLHFYSLFLASEVIYCMKH